ncbi:MAG TPA: peptidoglycan-binding domain-containing protein [Chthoniobacterales bacterium]|nr:peptidoglycan-binding domain-containing protein [Chthoniobacterales bacterium]
MKKIILIILALGLRTTSADMTEILCDRPFFHATDSLAPHDDWGLLHQMPAPNATDFAPRYHWRPFYYFESGRELIAQPAYVGALQRDLRRLGYYCGPIDGVFSDEVSDAIARLQKNYSMRVTGTITIPVRRALFLP